MKHHSFTAYPRAISKLSQRYLHASLMLFVFLFSIFLLQPHSVNAAVNLDASNELRKAARAANYNAETNETTLAATAGKIISVILTSMGVFFMALMVYAGYLWMTARGEEAPIEKAQTIIRGSIIGLIIVMGAYAITNFVVPKVLERTVGPGGGAPTVGTRRP